MSTSADSTTHDSLEVRNPVVPDQSFKSKINRLSFPVFSILIWILVIFNQAYFQGIFEVSEAREGVVVNEIKTYGTWLLPLRHGEVVPSKPPLFHWIAAALSPHSTFLSEFSLRLPSLLASLLCFLVVFRFLKHRFSESAFNAVLILSSTYGFFQMSLDGRVDMLFTFLFLLTLLMINRTLLNPESTVPSFKTKIVLGIVIGLSILSRGPLGLVLTLICLISGLLALKQFSNFKSWFTKDRGIFLLLPILISAPWYIASKFLGKPELISKQLIFENVSRFVGSDKIPAKPVWFYLQHLPLQLTVWFVILLFALSFYVRNRTSSFTPEVAKTLKLFVVQSIAIVVFLSLASGKRRAYLLQVLPLFSIILSLLLSEIKKSFDFDRSQSFLKCQRFMKYFSYLLLSLFLCQLILKVLPISFINFFSDAYYFSALKELKFSSLIVPTFAIILIHFWFSNSIKREKLKLVQAIWLISIETYVAVPGFFFLVKGESHSLKKFALDVQTRVGQSELSVIKKREDESFDSFLFYYGKRVTLTPLETSALPEGYFISRKTWLEQHSSSQTEEYDHLFDGKRLADKDEKLITVFKTGNEDQLETNPPQDYE